MCLSTGSFNVCQSATAVQRQYDISDSFPMGDNYTDIQSVELHLCIINHLTVRPVRIERAKQQAHSYTSRFIKHTQSGYLSNSLHDWCQSPVTLDQLESVRMRRGSACVSERACTCACMR